MQCLPAATTTTTRCDAPVVEHSCASQLLDLDAATQLKIGFAVQAIIYRCAVAWSARARRKAREVR